MDAAGNVFIAGNTNSPNFPTTTGVFDTAIADRDAFVAKLDATGTALIYSTAARRFRRRTRRTAESRQRG